MAVSNTKTAAWELLVAYSRSPVGDKSIELGFDNPDKVLSRVPVFECTVNVPEYTFPTYTLVPCGLTAIAHAPAPDGKELKTVFVAVSMMVTVPEYIEVT